MLPAINAIDFERLFQLRLVIARLGEMDNAGWWNTKGLLSTTGTFVMKRGFSRTYPFAQARASFAVAASQCRTLTSLINGATLWQLPAVLEDQFEDKWQTWLDDTDRWHLFFGKVSTLETSDVLKTLQGLNLITDDDASTIRNLKNAVEGHSLLLPRKTLDDTTINLLAAGFAHSAPGKTVVPYILVNE